MVKNNQNRKTTLSRFIFKICTLLSGIIFLSGCTSLLDSAIRDIINAPHRYDVPHRYEGLLLDEEIGHFKVFAKNISGDHQPANIPVDAIELALIDFCGIRKNYPYFNRIVNASQKSLKMQGYTKIYLIQDNKSYLLQLYYHGKLRQMEVLVNTSPITKTYAIDFSKFDVEIK